MKNGYLFLASASGLATAYAVRESIFGDEGVHWGSILLFGALFFLFGKLGYHKIEEARAVEQLDRDETARRVLELLRQPRDERPYEPRYSLYLRSFASTGLVRLVNPALAGKVGMEKVGLLASFDVEEWLVNAMATDAPLVALGVPGETIGAGRIGSEQWQSDFFLLARHAEVIFMAPAPTKWVLWELEWLRSEGMLQRVVFVMVPTLCWAQARENWTLTRQEFGDRDVELPHYEDAGCLLILSSPPTTIPFPTGSVEAFANAVRSLIPYLVK